MICIRMARLRERMQLELGRVRLSAPNWKTPVRIVLSYFFLLRASLRASLGASLRAASLAIRTADPRRLSVWTNADDDRRAFDDHKNQFPYDDLSPSSLSRSLIIISCAEASPCVREFIRKFIKGIYLETKSHRLRTTKQVDVFYHHLREGDKQEGPLIERINSKFKSLK